MRVVCLFLNVLAHSPSALMKKVETLSPKKSPTLNERLNEEANNTLQTFTNGTVYLCKILEEGAAELTKTVDIEAVGNGVHISTYTAAVYGTYQKSCARASLHGVLEKYHLNLTEWINGGPVGYGCAGKPKGAAAGGVFVCAMIKGGECSYPRIDPSTLPKPKNNEDDFVIKLNWTLPKLEEFYAKNNITDFTVISA